MDNEKEKIFSAIRAALEPLPARTPYPDWDVSLAVSESGKGIENLKPHFAKQLEAASALFFDSVSKLTEFLKTEGANFGYCDPELSSLFEGIDDLSIETTFDEAKVDAYQFGITRASTGIAESGTIVLKDADTSTRMGALTPWIHIAVLREQDIVAVIGDAISQFGDDPNIIFCTGPSKTADVEGILIKGVHGPGIQIALVL